MKTYSTVTTICGENIPLMVHFLRPSRVIKKLTRPVFRKQSYFFRPHVNLYISLHSKEQGNEDSKIFLSLNNLSNNLPFFGKIVINYVIEYCFKSLFCTNLIKCQFTNFCSLRFELMRSNLQERRIQFKSSTRKFQLATRS